MQRFDVLRRGVEDRGNLVQGLGRNAPDRQALVLPIAYLPSGHNLGPAWIEISTVDETGPAWRDRTFTHLRVAGASAAVISYIDALWRTCSNSPAKAFPKLPAPKGRWPIGCGPASWPMSWVRII
nr:hypothetical protein [Sphingomonas bacterium]